MSDEIKLDAHCLLPRRSLHSVGIVDALQLVTRFPEEALAVSGLAASRRQRLWPPETGQARIFDY